MCMLGMIGYVRPWMAARCLDRAKTRAGGSEKMEARSRGFLQNLAGGVLLLALSALLLALGMTAVTPSKAHADEVKYYGLVTYIPAYDEKGYPEYDADGTPIQNASVMLYGISGASGVVKLPESFDLTVFDEDGTGTEVVSNVKPSILSIQRCYHSEELEEEWGHASWSNGNVAGIDLTLCKDLRALYFSRDTSCEGAHLAP